MKYNIFKSNEFSIFIGINNKISIKQKIEYLLRPEDNNNIVTESKLLMNNKEDFNEFIKSLGINKDIYNEVKEKYIESEDIYEFPWIIDYNIINNINIL